MQAIEAFCAHLEVCLETGKLVEPDHALLEAVSVQLSLAIEQVSNPDFCRSVPLDQVPDTFGPVNVASDESSAIYACDGTTKKVSLAPPFRSMRAEHVEGLADPSRSPDAQYYTDRCDFVGVYDVKADTLIRRLSWDRDSAEACTVNVAFSKDSSLVAVSYAYDNSVRIWRLNAEHHLSECRAPDHEAAICFNADGRLLLAGTKSGTRLFHVVTGLSVLTLPTRQTYALGMHPADQFFVVEDKGPQFRVIDLSGFQKSFILNTEKIIAAIEEYEALFLESPLDWWPWSQALRIMDQI